MPQYIRSDVPGGPYFFTVVTHRRRPILLTPRARRALRTAIDLTRRHRPFETDAVVLLPDHLHTIWTLPHGDEDFALRWRLIKSRFTRIYLASGGREAGRNRSRISKGERGLWQRRYWERTIRDDAEFEALSDYIHYNPVKHGLAECPHGWPYSSFSRLVKEGRYDADWCCACKHRTRGPHLPRTIEKITGE